MATHHGFSRADLRAALTELEKTAPDCHAVVVAHHLHERPMPEIAAALCITEPAARTLLRLGCRALAAILRRGKPRER